MADEHIHLEGTIRDISYKTCFRKAPLSVYTIDDFDINKAKGSGEIDIDGHKIGYSKWVSPKRTRSYPFARIYDTYHAQKKVTIIPVIKDEGRDADNDRINFMTLAWMNLLNVYIILAWYDEAEKDTKKPDKIKSQKFDSEYVRAKLKEISTYHFSALHWNTTHFERDFKPIFEKAVTSYQQIQAKAKVQLHPSEKHLGVLKQYLSDGQFDLEKFKEVSLEGSSQASFREQSTTHALESLSAEGFKGNFTLRNMLGGKYYLTADEVFWNNGKIIIRESKNATQGKKIPSGNDIKDGLCKLMLFSNLDKLLLNYEGTAFEVWLRLTSTRLLGSVTLPAKDAEIDEFVKQNSLSKNEAHALNLLDLEAKNNRNLQIIIEPA